MSERDGTTRVVGVGVNVSDEAIAKAVETTLRDPNATTKFTSLNAVVHHLESLLGLDLTHKIDFITAHIHFLLRSQPPPPPPPVQNDPFAPHPNPSSHLSPRPKAEPCFPRPETTTAAQPPKQSAQPAKRRRGGPGGLNKLCGVTPELQVIVGQPALARTEIVKQLWAYIRKNNLQDPSNKRKIICNDELRLVFETDCTDMFKMNKLLAKHIITLEPTKATGQSSKKPRVEVGSGKDLADSDPIVIISEPLANLFGTSGREMPQSEASRLVWQYAKLNQLEDPMNPMAIKCDTKLQNLLGCASISAMAVPEMLARLHLFKR